MPGSTLCRSATRYSPREEEKVLRELLVLCVIMTAVAAAIYISFA
jgi:hypothetical protein